MISLDDIQSSKILLLSEDSCNWNDFNKSLQMSGFQPLIISADINNVWDSEIISDADLIILDLDRTQIDKKKILRLIENQVRKSDCPIIAAKSMVLEEELNEYFEVGVKWFLEKPLSFVLTFPKIKVLLENRNLQKKLTHIFEDDSCQKIIEKNIYPDKISEIINIISHDLREPLRKVKKLSDLMVSKFQLDLPDLGKEYLDRIQKTVERMDQLICSTINLRDLTLKKSFYEELDLKCLVGEVLQDLEVLMDETGAKIYVRELPTIYGIPSQIRQLFQNLITNAIYYHKEGEVPEIEINYSLAQKGRVELRVQDKGLGISEENLDNIFLPFERLKEKKNVIGTGLGLTICRKIVELHDGDILASSEKGKGTTFLISLPQCPSQK